MARLPKNKGNLDLGGVSVDFSWGKDQLTLSTRTGAQLSFRLQAHDLAKQHPRELAKEVVETAVTQGVMNMHIELLADRMFPVEGPISRTSETKIFAVPVVPQ